MSNAARRDAPPGGRWTSRADRPLVVNSDAKRAGVVLEIVVIDPQKQSPALAHADRVRVVADEEVVVAIADAADERRRRPARDRPAVVARRAMLAARTILPSRSPAHAARRAHINCLPGADADSGVGPSLSGADVDIALPHAARSAAAGLAVIASMIARTGFGELDPRHLIALDPHPLTAEESALPFELDDAVADRDQLALHAPSVAHH